MLAKTLDTTAQSSALRHELRGFPCDAVRGRSPGMTGGRSPRPTGALQPTGAHNSAFVSHSTSGLSVAGFRAHNGVVEGLHPFLAIGALALLATSAQASTSEFIAAGFGEALVTTGSGTINITLTDLYVNPDGVAENMSGIIFTLNNTPTSASIATGAGTEITVNGSGNSGYVLGSSVATGWGIALNGATTALDALGGTAANPPTHTIIGPSGAGSLGYSNAGGSIAGNSAHNPFLDQTATFTLNEAGVTSSSTVKSTIFQFGTTDGQGQQPGSPVVMPEPSTLALLSCAAVPHGPRQSTPTGVSTTNCRHTLPPEHATFSRARAIRSPVMIRSLN
jgi:hypothetical protein